jgi:hypothetical protein
MPHPHVFFPDDAAALERAFAQPFARRPHARREARMPGLEERRAESCGLRGQQCDLAGRRGRRLFEQHMFARLERERRSREMGLGRRADRDAFDIRPPGEHCRKVGEIRDSLDAGIAAGAGDQFESLARLQNRDVLVPRDLSDAEQTHAQALHIHLLEFAVTGAGIYLLALPIRSVRECASLHVRSDIGQREDT